VLDFDISSEPSIPFFEMLFHFVKSCKMAN